MEVSPVKRTTITEQIFEQLKEKIINGELRPGDKMPSENELCKLYHVSRTSVRQALANLSSLNLIETRFGEGSFIKSPDSGIAMNPLLSHSFLSEKSIVEVVEFRQLIEPNVTKLACLKATMEDIEQLEQIYAQMVQYKNDLKQFATLDCNFHTTIAKISRNAYVIKIYEIISDVLLNAFSDIVLKRGNEAGLKYHKEIISAFKNKDAEQALIVMQEHMDDMRHDIVKND